MAEDQHADHARTLRQEREESEEQVLDIVYSWARRGGVDVDEIPGLLEEAQRVIDIGDELRAIGHGCGPS